MLPIATSKLRPPYPTRKDVEGQGKQRNRQQTYYNLSVKEHRPILSGQTIRMKLPGRLTWSIGICRGLVGSRSYKV